MAPMIESPFAMQKFVNAARKVYKDRVKNIEWIINTETKTCMENLDDIFAAGEGFLNTISIGRVDLSASMGLNRSDIDGDVVFDAASTIAQKAKNVGLTVGIGGGVQTSSLPFFLKLQTLLDKFETRKIVFKMSNDEQLLKRGLVLAMEFEMLYLKNKCDFYAEMELEDRGRLKMLEQRYTLAKNELN